MENNKLSNEEVAKRITALKKFMITTGKSSEDAFRYVDEFVKLIDPKGYKDAHEKLEQVKLVYYELEELDFDGKKINIQEECFIDEKFKIINELGYKFRTSKDDKEKSQIESELKNIIISLKKDAIAKFENESDIKKFLDNCIKFNNYSFNNQCLIWAQRPDAEYVMSFKTIKDMGYKLNKDSKGIKIFIPKFVNLIKVNVTEYQIDIKPYSHLDDEEKQKLRDKNDDSVVVFRQKLVGFMLGNVFDAKDTNMPLDEINNELYPILEDKRADEIMDCFIKTIYKDGFKVEFQELTNGTKGYCDYKNNLIVLKKGLGSLMQLKVLIHEYAHGLAHQHLENNNMEYKKHRNKYETEAESIAYVVSKYLGMNTNDSSLSYLYAWSKEKDFKEIDDSLSTIVNYSKRIITNFEKFYDIEFGLYADEFNSISIQE